MIRYIDQLELKNRRVLIRADLNVPLAEGIVTDDSRIKQFLPTLKQVLQSGGRPIVMSHLGEPSGKSAEFSLRPVAQKMSELLEAKVHLAPDCVGGSVSNLVEQLAPGEVLLLENLRFNQGEKTNSPEFAKELAALGDVYVDDAFGTMHRSHASIVGVPKIIKEHAAGLLVKKELEFYNRALVNPKKPLCVVLGGAKVSSKLNMLLNLAEKADKLIIGGAMANTFLAAQGLQMGRSKFESDLFSKVLSLMGTLARRDCKLYLPVDFIVAPSLNSKGMGRPVPWQEIPADMMALDVGPATNILFKEALTNSETVVWNGPMGAFENEEFAQGTYSMIESIGTCHGLRVVGGGDTDAAIHKMELAHKFDFVSSGGGAFLTLLEGKGLVGVSALE